MWKHKDPRFSITIDPELKRRIYLKNNSTMELIQRGENLNLNYICVYMSLRCRGLTSANVVKRVIYLGVHENGLSCSYRHFNPFGWYLGVGGPPEDRSSNVVKKTFSFLLQPSKTRIDDGDSNNRSIPSQLYNGSTDQDCVILIKMEW
jgi:hypothetical protein